MKEIKVKLITQNGVPVYSSECAAGCDVNAHLESSCVIKPLERKLIPTGLRIQMPEGCEAQVRPRSGLALKHGITVLNTPGTVDPDYTGEIGVILINLSDKEFTINPGDRIAQIVFNSYEKAKFEIVDKFEETERGEGGFGHTGI